MKNEDLQHRKQRKPLEAELVAPDHQETLHRLRQLAQLLDNRFEVPGTGFRFGADALLGLVPGIGDALGGVLSLYIIYSGARLGVRYRALTRMLWNTGIDTLLGAIPLLGDLFDVAWQANRLNVAIVLEELERHPCQPREPSQIRTAFLFILAFGSVLVLISAVVSILLIVRIISVLAF